MSLTFKLFEIIMTVTHCKTELACLGSLLSVEFEWSSQMRPAKRTEAVTKPTVEQNQQSKEGFEISGMISCYTP